MTSNRYNVPELGTTDWHIPLNENFERLNREIEIRDLKSNLEEYDPTNGSKYLATDTGEVYLGDGEQWTSIGSIKSGGSSEGGDIQSTATHSVFVREITDGTYAAFTADGSRISSGSNGREVLQTGIDSCPTGGSVNVVGEYEIDETVTLGDGKRMVGYEATITIAETSSNMGFAIEVCNGSEGTSQDLEEDASARDNELYVGDASEFDEGDHIYIERDQTFTAGKEGDLQYSEKHLVDRIDTSDDVLYLMEGVYFDYPTSDGAQVTQIQPDSGHLEGFTVTNEQNDPDGNYRFANAIRGHNVTYRNLTLKNVGRTGVSFDECYGGTVTGCEIDGIHKSGSGYGVRIRAGCANTLISNNHIRACRHNIAHNYGGNGDGMPRKTLIIGNVCLGSHQGANLDAHEGTLDWAIIGNHISANNNVAINNGAKDVAIYNNVFLGAYEESGKRQGGFLRARGNPPQSDMTIRGNHIKHSGRLGGIWIAREGPWGTIDISDNYIQDTAYYFVRIQEDVDFLRVSDNVFDNSEHPGDGREAILVEDSVDSIGAAQISGNAFRSYDEAIHVESGAGSIANFAVTGNTVYATPWNGGTNAFDFNKLIDSVIADNTFHDPDGNLGDAVVLGSNTENNLIHGNNIHSSGGISDGGSGNLAEGNYQHDGSGWSQL
jgi:hypothetical protein